MIFARAAQLPSSINNYLQKNNIPSNEISIWVQNVNNDVPLVELNSEVLRTPASVAKLLTTSVGLFRLGADYRWQTQFFVDNLPDSSGVVNGNLYIVGGGDPFLVNEQLVNMLKGLRAAGVRHITGDIILDESLYQLTPLERDPGAFDQYPWSAYNAIPDPLMVNFRTISVNISGGGTPKISLTPKMDNWKINNQIRRVNQKKCGPFTPALSLKRESNGYATLSLSGTLSSACGSTQMTIVAGEGSEQFYYLFRDIWYSLGGSFDGGGRLAHPPSTAKQIFIGYSDPLVKQIQRMNQFSNNVMTRQLFLTIGINQFGAPGTLEKGRNAVLMGLEELGVNTTGIFVDNGAGLSRVAKVSAHQLAMLLRNIYLSDRAPDFLQSLAVAGESGTLKNRYRNTELQGNVYGKTGTINGVVAFAGFVRSRSGQNYIVVIIDNGQSAPRSRKMQEDVFRWVYQQ